MYKVVLVDDEEIVLEGLKKKINWERLRLQVVGGASNGLEALKIIEETNPDILITDVIMPVMNGLKLMETLKETNRDIKTVILSGYDEFEYAQKAVKLGAAEYQLKPVSVEEIEAVLERIIKDLDNEKMEEKEKHRLKMEKEQNSEMLIRHIFTSILESRADNYQSLIKKVEEIDSRYLHCNLVAAVLEVDDYSQIVGDNNDKEKELVIFSVLNITNEIVSSNNRGFTTRLNEKRLVIIMIYNNEWSRSQIYNSYKWLFYLVIDNLKKYLGYSVTIGVGQVVCGISNIRDSFLNASKAVKAKLLHGTGRIIRYEDITENSWKLQELYAENEKKLLEFIEEFDSRNVFDYIDSLHKTIRSDNYSYEDVISLCYKLVLLAKNELNQVSRENFATGTEIELLEKIRSFEHLDELMEWVKKFYSYAFDAVKSHSQKKYSYIVSRVIEYIETNYMKKIELAFLAEKLYISANYLSTLFKKETGVTFKTYLTRFRLEKARKLLLEPHYKIYQIANAIGYENEEYLCRLFKNYYGVTCKEFRDSNGIK